MDWMTAAERQKVYRARKGAGVRLLTVDVSPELIQRMVYAGLINGDQANQTELVCRALQQIIDAWGPPIPVTRNAKT